MDNNLIDFLTEIECSITEEDVFEAFLKAIKLLGFERVSYAYAQSKADGEPSAFFLTNYDDGWVDYLIKNVLDKKNYLTFTIWICWMAIVCQQTKVMNY